MQASEQKIEQFYRDATPDDVAMMLRTNELQDARFRNRDDEGWQRNAKLMGCCIHWGRRAWMDEDMTAWKCCQVYDLHEWYKYKPDPGEGYRLLEKFPPEPKLKTDESWFPFGSYWQVVKNDNGVQAETIWYRRRIETKPPQCVERVCGLAKSTGVTCPHDSCDLETKVREASNPETPNSCDSQGFVTRRWASRPGDELVLPSGKFMKITAKQLEVL
jgi:hypothetical protein